MLERDRGQQSKRVRKAMEDKENEKDDGIISSIRSSILHLYTAPTLAVFSHPLDYSIALDSGIEVLCRQG